MFEGKDSPVTQQAEADDGGDDAAGSAATSGTRAYTKDLPGAGKADPGCATGVDQVLTRWPSCHPENATPMEMRTDLARLFDISTPNIARVYDYWLGGKDNSGFPDTASCWSTTPRLPG